MAGEPVQRRLQFVLEHYGKRPTENVILNYFGLANEVYTITTAEGKFVVKNCFKNNTKELVGNEAALICYLNEQGVPCPKLVPTKDKNTYLDYDGQFYIMSEFMEGYVPKWEEAITDDIAVETVHAMADYHRVTEYFKPPFESGRIGTLDVEDAARWVEALGTELAEDKSGRESVNQMRIIVKDLLVHAQALKIELEATDLSVLKKVFIHGDLHCFNLIFNEDKSKYNGIVDFDFIREDYRLVDFYWASRSMAWSYWFPKLFGFDPNKRDFEPTDEQFSKITTASFKFMIENYRKFHDLPDEEIRLLPLFAKALPLYIIRFFKLSNSEDECLDHADWFSWKLRNMSKSVANIEAAIDAFFIGK